MKLQQFFSKHKSKRVLLLTHHNADVDAVASTIVLDYFLHKLGFRSVDCASTGGVSLQARNLLKYARNQFLESVSSDDYDMVVLLDTSTPNQIAGIDPTSIKNLVLIDHHHPSKAFSGEHFINPDAVATVQIVHGGFSLPLTKNIARLVIAGIITDSAYLKLADSKIFKTVSDLLNKHKIEYGSVLNELYVPMSSSEKIARIKAGQRTALHKIGKYIVVTSKVSSFEASAARSLISMGADVTFVGAKAKDARISARARANFIKATGISLGQSIMPEVGVFLGGSGSGHSMAAGANGPQKDRIDKALDLCVDLLRKEIQKHGKRNQ